MKPCISNNHSSKALLQIFSIFFLSGCALTSSGNQQKSANLNFKKMDSLQKKENAYRSIDSIREYRQFSYEYSSDTDTYRTLFVSNHGIHGMLTEIPGEISFDDSLAKIGTKYISICEESIAKGFANGSPKILFENHNDKMYIKENVKNYTRQYCLKEENGKIIISIHAGLITGAEVAVRLKSNRNKYGWPALAYGGGINYWSTGCEVSKNGDSIEIWPFQVNAPE